jgi:hypothetical protein
MSEAALERRCAKVARLAGGKLIKVLPWLNTGLPDRILIMPGGWIVFMEFKAPIGRLRAKQKWWQDWLTSKGCNHAVIRSMGEFEEWMYPPESEDPYDMGWVDDRGRP